MRMRMPESKIGIFAQNIVSFSTACAIVFAAGWKLYAEENVDRRIERALKPVIVMVKANRIATQRNADALEQVDFNTKQILLILKKTNKKSVIKEVEEETEQFRPKRKL